MKRELFLHFSFWFSFFVFISLIRKYFSLPYWPFWLGGIVGTILPDIDHIIYLYLKPQELTTQRVNFLLDSREIKRVFILLYETRSERNSLIFHTVLFQLIFLVVTFWILTSSGSIFAQGIVLAFALHLVVDQIVDIQETGNFDNWLKNIPVYFDLKGAKRYWLIVTGVTLLLGFFV